VGEKRLQKVHVELNAKNNPKKCKDRNQNHQEPAIKRKNKKKERK